MIEAESTKATKQIVQELKEKHEELAKLAMEGFATLYFRPPTPGEWARYVDGVKGKGSLQSAGKQLVLACLVHPAADVAEEVLRKKPAAVMPIADAIGQLGGGDQELELSKA
jgi:hypothetical protein